VLLYLELESAEDQDPPQWVVDDHRDQQRFKGENVSNSEDDSPMELPSEMLELALEDERDSPEELPGVNPADYHQLSWPDSDYESKSDSEESKSDETPDSEERELLKELEEQEDYENDNSEDGDLLANALETPSDVSVDVSEDLEAIPFRYIHKFPYPGVPRPMKRK